MADTSDTAAPLADVLTIGPVEGVYYQRLGGLYKRDIAGQGALVALAVARMGGQAALAARFGDDDLAQDAQRLLTNEGVDLSACRTTADPTPHRIVNRSRDGHMMPGPTAFAATELLPARLPTARVIHRTLDHAAAPVQAGKALLSLEIPPGGQGANTTALAQCDLVFAPLGTVLSMFGTSAVDRALDVITALGAQLVLLHDDTGIWLRSTGGTIQIPPIGDTAPLTEVARAALIGTFLSSLTAGDDLTLAALRAQQAAQIAMVQPGWASVIPALEDLPPQREIEMTPSAARAQPMVAGP